MAKDSQNSNLVLGEHRGYPIYETNPSVPAKGAITRSRKKQIGDEQRGMLIADGTGEVIGRGTAVTYEWEEVDAERFVKLFLSGLKQATDLTKSGLMIFEIVYNQLRENPNSDQVPLSFYSASKAIPNLAQRTYSRGLRELLEKEFLYRSPFPGMFFVNIRYMFNGDRLAFVKAYHLKGARKNDAQLSFLPEAGEGQGGPKPVS